MIKDVEPLLKECEETLAELIRMGNMEVACYVQGFINSINKLPDAEQRPQSRSERLVVRDELISRYKDTHSDYYIGKAIRVIENLTDDEFDRLERGEAE